MNILITYEYRLYPTKKQLRHYKQWLEVHRQIWNICLETKIAAYKQDKTNLSGYDLIKLILPKFKGKSHSASMQQTVLRVDKSFKAFFRRCKNKENPGFPRFKKQFRTIEFAQHNSGIKFDFANCCVKINRIGKIAAKFHRHIPENAKIKTGRLVFKNGRLYAQAIVEMPTAIHCVDNIKSVGIDPGIATTLTLSTGEKLTSPQFTKPTAKNLARLQRRKELAVVVFEKRKLAKAIRHIYIKSQRQRTDYNHKLSRKIVDSFDIICMEDFKPSEVTSWANVNRRLYDLGLTQLKSLISYKAENAGKAFVLVNPAYTTQMCSNCGVCQPKELSERLHQCSCGCTLDRDINAAINIENIGLRQIQHNSYQISRRGLSSTL